MIKLYKVTYNTTKVNFFNFEQKLKLLKKYFKSIK